MTYTAVTFLDGFPYPASPFNDISTELAALSGAANAEWTLYTPAWTSTGTTPAIGNGTLAGRYINPQVNLIVAEIRLVAGSTTTFGTGDWRLSLPVSASTAEQDYGTGSAYLLDSGTTERCGSCRVLTATTIGIYSPTGAVSATVPWTFANGDQVRLSISYEPV